MIYNDSAIELIQQKTKTYGCRIEITCFEEYWECEIWGKKEWNGKNSSWPLLASARDKEFYFCVIRAIERAWPQNGVNKDGAEQASTQ